MVRAPGGLSRDRRALKGLKLEFPKVEGAALKELENARRALEAETPKRRKRRLR